MVGDKTSICTTYVILVDIQGGSDLKCGFPQHLDNWDERNIKCVVGDFLLSLPVPELSGYWRQVSAVLVCR